MRDYVVLAQVLVIADSGLYLREKSPLHPNYLCPGEVLQYQGLRLPDFPAKNGIGGYFPLGQHHHHIKISLI